MLIDLKFSLNKAQDDYILFTPLAERCRRFKMAIFCVFFTYVIFHQSVAGNLAKIDLASYMRLQILAYIANTYYRMAV
jgi:hypothetical protein